MHFTYAASDDSDKSTRCGQYSAFAKQLMTLRQNNVPVSTVMSTLSQRQNELKAEGDSHDGEYQFYLSLIKQAYAIPVYRSLDDQQSMINDFTNKAYLMCMDNQFL